MNNKKVLALGILSLFIISSLAGIVFASWEEAIKNDGLGKFFKYLFGPLINNVDLKNVSNVNDVSLTIITIAVWLLIFITFSDIISAFSTFSQGVSWGIGFLVAVIAANLGFVVLVVASFASWFAFAGTAAVFIGLGGAFIAFIVVNLGLVKFKPWIDSRKRMVESSRIRRGANEAAEGVHTSRRIARAARENL
jgi:hypothetical protein